MANGPTFFDAQSAIRIANAVRKVEIGDRAEAALRFRRELPQQQRKTFRIATFSGAWAIGATKTVTYKYQSSTPNTANVTNLFFPIVGTATSSVDCAIAKDGTAWFLIDVPFQNISVITDVSLTTAGLQFTRASVSVASSATLSITTIGTTAC